MLENRYDISLQQGSTFNLVLTVKDSFGNNINASGYDARMQIRSSYAASTPTINLSVGSGINIDGPNGTFSITITAAQTANIKVDLSQNKNPPHTNYVYDFETIDTSGTTSKLIYGTATVYGEVTR